MSVEPEIFNVLSSFFMTTFSTFFPRFLTLERRLVEVDQPDRLGLTRAFDPCRGLGVLNKVLTNQKPLILGGTVGILLLVASY